MKKQLFYLLAAIATVLSMTSCSDDDDPIVLSMEFTPKQFAAANINGDTLNVVLSASTAWTATSTTSGVYISPASGTACTGQEVSIMIPASGADSRIIEVKFALADHEFVIDPLYISQHGHTITYEGITYKVDQFGDGNIWMCENLRYIPSGITPSDDPTVNAGIWYPYTSDGTTTTALTDAESITKFGYLYSYATALATDTATLRTNPASLQRARGICPEGWHVPSIQEYVNLFGCSTKLENGTELKNIEAPFYDDDYEGARISSLNDTSSFNLAFSGVRMQTIITAAPKYQGNIYDNHLALSYYLSSTYYKSAYSTTTGLLTNVQYFGMMTTFNGTKADGKFSGAYLGYLSGAALRCVKDNENNTEL